MSENEEIEKSEDSEDINFQNLTNKSIKFKTSEWLFKFLLVFGACFLLSFLLFQVILTPIKIVGTSMQPTMNVSVTSEEDENHSDIAYYKKQNSYTNGEIVIVSNETQQYLDSQKSKFFIKRVIGKPGDKITFLLTDIQGEKFYYEILVYDKDGNNITPDEDSYTKEDMYFTLSDYNYTYFFNPNSRKIFANLVNGSLGLTERKTTITIEENKYFVMGDNRNVSLDSRYFGSVDIDDIEGSVKLHVKYGQSTWVAVLKSLKSIFSSTNISLKKEYL